ncbi:MAG: LPS export ABC transporter periplasmic protein LptC [Chlorobi bacterium]|nr:LPS export ABC transporter periplasmic protein LptC [Chlorobiota bacterium]
MLDGSINKSAGVSLMVLLGFLGILALPTGCKHDIEEVSKLQESLGVPPEKGYDVEVMYYDSGYLEFKLVGKELTIIPREKQDPLIEVDSFNLYLYDKEGRVYTKIKANSGTVDLPNKLMWAKGHVFLWSREGNKLNTDEIVWDLEEERIYTYSDVRLETPEGVIYGQGFETDPSFKTYRITKMKGTIKVNLD